MSETSYKTILQSSSIMGAASVLNVLSGVVKMKAAAVLLGPAGVGFIGIYQSLVQTASQIASLGFPTVGTQQIASAAAAGGAKQVGPVRRTLFLGTMGLALIGAIVFFALRGLISSQVLQEPERSADVAWLSFGVAFTVVASYQTALLTGLRHIRVLAVVQVGAGLFTTILGIGALWLWGSAGIPALVIALPLMTFVIGLAFVVRLGRPEGPRTDLGEMARKWREFTVIGFPFMLSGLVTTLGHLMVRTLVQRDLGPEALGHFQASWMIGMTYLSFVLGAMGTDFFPRLSGAILDHGTARRLVNEQTEVALILSGPPLVAMLALAPVVVQLLYSAEFGPAVEILRWQLLGDILKIISWPLGFVLLAAGAGRLFFISETIGMAVLVVVVASLLPVVGVVGTGIGFALHYLVYLPVVWMLARRMIGFKWTASVKRLALILVVASSVTDIAVRLNPFFGGIIGLMIALFLALNGATHLMRQSEQTGHIARLARRIKNLNAPQD